MDSPEVSPRFADDAAIQAERADLVRLCAWLTGDRHLAEDIAQEALLIAWQQQDRLRDPTRHRQWLSGIARNLCRRWLRHQRREYMQGTSSCDQRSATASDTGLPAEAFDLDVELERHELADLLDRALAMLPRLTRTMLIERYIRETPQAELARRLGVSEGVVEARVHRGKLSLRRILTTDLQDEAAAYGLYPPAGAGWQATRIWCPTCGQRCLIGRLQHEGLPGLQLRCECGANFAGTSPPFSFEGVHGYRASFSRLARWHVGYFQHSFGSGAVPCVRCGHLANLHLEPSAQIPPAFVQLPPALPGSYGFWVHCTACHNWSYQSDIIAIALFLPEAQRFWRAHPRMRSLPPHLCEMPSGPTIVTGFQDLSGPARLDMTFAQASLSLLQLQTNLNI